VVGTLAGYSLDEDAYPRHLWAETVWVGSEGL